MKIAYLSTFYPFRGGITHFNHSLYNAFKINHNIEAFTFKRQYPDILFPGKTQYVTDEDLIEKIPAKRVLDTINPITYISSAKEIAKSQPDLMVMKYWMPFFAPSLGFVAKSLKKKGTKVVTILDNVLPHEKKFYDLPFTRYFLRQNSGFVVMSETVRNDLLSIQPQSRYIFNEHPLYNHFGNKISKTESRKKLGIPESKKVLLFFGFVRDYKGLDLLLEAFSMLDDSYYLIVAGEVYGDDKKYLDLVSKFKLEEKSSINLRYIRDDEVPLFFSAADVNVLPYRSATQSGILSIAWHFELPVIVTDVGSLGQPVLERNTGLVAEKADPMILKEKIEEYFNSGKQAVYEKNICQLKEENSWENLARSITDFASAL